MAFVFLHVERTPDPPQLFLDDALRNGHNHLLPSIRTPSPTRCGRVGRVEMALSLGGRHHPRRRRSLVLHDACVRCTNEDVVPPRWVVYRPGGSHCCQPRAPRRSVQGRYAQPSGADTSTALGGAEGLRLMASLRHRASCIRTPAPPEQLLDLDTAGTWIRYFHHQSPNYSLSQSIPSAHELRPAAMACIYDCTNNGH